MSRYYFDVRNNDRLFADTEGTCLASGMDAVRTEAFAALTDYAREVTPTTIRRRLAVEVRDENSTTLFKAAIDLVIEVIAANDPEQPQSKH
jgi:hypothetical protein